MEEIQYTWDDVYKVLDRMTLYFDMVGGNIVQTITISERFFNLIEDCKNENIRAYEYDCGDSQRALKIQGYLLIINKGVSIKYFNDKKQNASN